LKDLPFVSLSSALSLLLLLLLWPIGLKAMAPVQRTVLPNGFVILQVEDHSLPFVTMQLLVDGGSCRDPSGKGGLSHITAKTLLLGSESKTARQISEELDFMGASLSAAPGRDFTVISLRVLKKDLLKGFSLLTDALARPTFPEDEIRREIEKASANLQSQEDDPGTVAEREFLRTLFSNGAYGHPVEGSKTSLAGVTRDLVLKFFNTYFIPKNSILTVVGDVTATEVRTLLLPILEKLPAGASSQTSLKITPVRGPKTVNIRRPIAQANIVLGHAGISRDNPDFHALSVMNYILGRGGFASRLNQEVRARRGLAYSITSLFDTGKHSGSFQVVLQTKKESAKEAIGLVLRELERIRKELVSEQELEGAKRYLIGSFPMRLDTQAKMAGFVSQSEFYGLGLDYDLRYQSFIEAVTKEDVLAVAKTYLHPERLFVVVVGNSMEAGDGSPVVPPGSSRREAQP
jgi:zinc protease